MKKNIDLGILVIRIATGILMLLHGIAKLGGIDFIKGLLTDLGLPAFVGYGVYLGEIVAPVLIIIGFRTRIAAIVFIINALFAMLLVHSSDIFSLNQHGGWGVELLELYLFGAVALFFTGSGRYALSSNNQWD